MQIFKSFFSVLFFTIDRRNTATTAAFATDPLAAVDGLQRVAVAAFGTVDCPA